MCLFAATVFVSNFVLECFCALVYVHVPAKKTRGSHRCYNINRDTDNGQVRSRRTNPSRSTRVRKARTLWCLGHRPKPVPQALILITFLIYSSIRISSLPHPVFIPINLLLVSHFLYAHFPILSVVDSNLTDQWENVICLNYYIGYKRWFYMITNTGGLLSTRRVSQKRRETIGVLQKRSL